MTQTAETVWRDYVTDMVPSSDKNEPDKVEIRKWGTWVENGLLGATAGATIYASKSDMEADTSQAANAMGWVLGDDTAANNGIYQFDGTSTWTRLGDLPYSYIKATNAGAGTANAIEATTSVPVPAADGGALIALPIVADNTASPVTVTINGVTYTIKTNSGNDPVVGGLTAGMIAAGYVSGSTFRLLSDQSSAALVADAEAAADRAEAAAASIEIGSGSDLSTDPDKLAKRGDVNNARIAAQAARSWLDLCEYDSGLNNNGAGLSAAVTAALALISSERGTIYFRPGDYLADAEIVSNGRSIHFDGPGGDSAVVKKTAADMHVFHVGSAHSSPADTVHNVTFTDFCIDGGDFVDSSDDFDLVRGRLVDNFHVHRMILRNGGCGIKANYGKDNENFPTFDSRRSRNVFISGNYFENLTWFGTQMFGVNTCIETGNIYKGGALSTQDESAAARHVWCEDVIFSDNIIDYYDADIADLGKNGGLLMTGDNSVAQTNVRLERNTILVSGGPAMSLRGPMLRPVIRGNLCRAAGSTDDPYVFHLDRNSFDDIVDPIVEDNVFAATSNLVTTVALIDGAVLKEQGGVRRNTIAQWDNLASGTIYGLYLNDCGGVWPVEGNNPKSDAAAFVAFHHDNERAGLVPHASKNVIHIPDGATAFSGSSWIKGHGATWKGWDGSVKSGTAVDDNTYITAPALLSGGTNIGDLTGGDGLAGLFDGDTDKTAAASSSEASSSSAWGGKSWSDDIGLSHVYVYAPSDGFISGADPNVTLRLYGKSGGAAPISESDGTLLDTVVATADTSDRYRLGNPNISTGYQHMWVRVTGSGGSGTTAVAQLQFYGWSS